MSTPLMGRPNDYGILTMDQKEIHEAVEDAHRGSVGKSASMPMATSRSTWC